MKAFILSVLFSAVLAGTIFADRVTLDTGNELEGIVHDEGDTVRLQYVSYQQNAYEIREIKIPRSRIKNIQRDTTYFERYKKLVRGLGGVSIAPPVVAGPHGDSLKEAIRQGNLQVQRNLQYEQEHMRTSKFYWGWHEGFHWDPNNGWHRWNHQGLYDPFDPNIKVRDR